MTVLKYSDIIDTGLYIKTSTKNQPNGVAGLDANGRISSNQLPTDIGGGGTGNSSSYIFKVNFSQASPSTIENVPTGWTISVNGNNVNVTHTNGSFPKFISYLGYNSGVYHYRTPTSFDEMLVNESTRTTQFSIALTNDVAGSQQSGHAYVSVLF